jgi:hypothetical protein
MFDSIRIRTSDEQTALTLTEDVLARFRPHLVHESEGEWEVRVESESEDDLPDLLGILYDRLRAPEPSLDLLINGELYRPGSGS